MKDIYESTGLSKEELEQVLKNPKSLDPMRMQMLRDNLKQSGRRTAIGVVTGVVIFGALIIGLIYAIDYYTSIVVEQTAPFTGDASRFDPISSYAEVKAHAGEGVKLLSIDAQFVKSDGTMDLYADYNPRAEYEFYRDSEPPKSAPPLGAGSNQENKWYQRIEVDVYRPGQMSHVSSMGGDVSYEYTYTNRGMDRGADDPVSNLYENEVPEPKCSFADLWKTAIEKGAPQGAVASIAYKADHFEGKPLYEFTIRDTKIDLNFDQDCKLMEELP